MRNIFRAGALAVGLLLCAAPFTAFAATIQHFTVSYTPIMGSGRDVLRSGVPFTGLLDITISDTGNINGYYHLDGDPIKTPVTGGRDSQNNAWLSIGGRVHLRFQGQFTDGAFVGSAYDDHNTQYTFTAKPNQTND